MKQIIWGLFAFSGLILLIISAFKPKLLWALLIPSTIITSAIMIKGYALFDEYLTGCILVGVLLAVSIGAIKQQKEKFGRFHKLHKFVFRLLMFYLVFQSIRGIIVCEDLRIFRFVFFYLMILVLSSILSNGYFQNQLIKKMALLISVSGAIYFLAYLGHGLFSEFVRGIDRFTPQGDEWSGSATAMFPAVITLASSLIFLEQNKKIFSKILFFIVIVLTVVIGFYYDSRMAGVTSIVFLFIFLLRYRYKILTIIKYAIAVSLVLFILGTYIKIGFRGTTLKSYFAQSFSSVASIFTTESVDVDRKMHFEKAFKLLNEDMTTILFGNGYYYHKIIFQRTTGFTALVLDTGSVGLLLFLFNFLLLFIKTTSKKDSYKNILVATLIMSLLWLIAAPILDMVILYLMIMPSGILEQLTLTGKMETN